MLDSANEAVSLAEGRSREDLESDRLLYLALTRLVEIIGNAATRIPQEERDNYPDVDWLRIVGMRNRLNHAYDVVDFDVLWQTITEDLPGLAVTLAKSIDPKD